MTETLFTDLAVCEPATALAATSASGCWRTIRYTAEALKYYDEGAEGLCVWDSYRHDVKGSLGPVMRRLGHVEELRALLQREEPEAFRTIHEVTSLNDYDLTVRDIPERNRILYPEGAPHYLHWPL